MLTFSAYKQNREIQYLVSLLLVVMTAAVGYLISNIAGYRVVALMLMVVVSLLAVFFDIRPVLLAAVLSALIWDFFFIPPRFTFSVGSTEDALMLLMYFFIALVNAVLTYRIRKGEKHIRDREEKEKMIRLYNTLLNSLSHELRTPIATIIGASDNLRSAAPDRLSEQNRTELLDEISDASLRLNQQVENLLNMSRLESGFIRAKKDWCDLGELLYTVLRQLGHQLEKHVVKVSLADDLPLFKIDFGLIEQVLYNVLSNAAQYTPEGSAILVDIHTKDCIMKDEAGIESVAAKLVILIADNGPGFPEREIGKVFDKFYRLQNTKAGGAGLGLSIAKGFVEAHEGTIQVRNWPGGGAEFIIEIPAETSYINALKNE